MAQGVAFPTNFTGKMHLFATPKNRSQAASNSVSNSTANATSSAAANALTTTPTPLSQSRLLFVPLTPVKRTALVRLYSDLTQQLKQIFRGSKQVACYLPYAETKLWQLLQPQFACSFVDPYLQTAADFKYLLDVINQQATCHAMFSQTALTDSLAGEIYQAPNLSDQAFSLAAKSSPLELAAKANFQIILLLDGRYLGQQTLFLLNQLLNHPDFAALIRGFDLYNLAPQAWKTWQQYLETTFKRPVLFNAATWLGQIELNELSKPAFNVTTSLAPAAKNALKPEATSARVNESVNGSANSNAAANGHEAWLKLSQRFLQRAASLNLNEPTLRVALAYDAAFNAYDNYELELLSQLGVVWCPFSPLKDSHLPKDCLALYLRSNQLSPYFQALCANRTLRRAIKDVFTNEHWLCFAQDLAHLYLIDGCLDKNDTYWPMVGLIPQKASYQINPLATYHYATCTPLRFNCCQPQLEQHNALFNCDYDLQPSLQSLKTLLAITPTQQIHQVTSGYCDGQIYSSLLTYLPSCAAPWLETFLFQLLELAARKQAF